MEEKPTSAPPKPSKRRLIMLSLGVAVSLGVLVLRKHAASLAARAPASAPQSVSQQAVDLGLRLSKVMLPTTSARDLSLELGVKLAKNKDYEGARKTFEGMLVTNPNDLSVLNNLAFVAGEQGQLDRAAEYLQSAVQISQSCAECYNNLGAVLYKQGKGERAREMYLRAVALDGKYVDPKLNLAVLYEEQSDWASALDWYRQAEDVITDPQLKSWVAQRSHWMAEITQSAPREVANQK